MVLIVCDQCQTQFDQNNPDNFAFQIVVGLGQMQAQQSILLCPSCYKLRPNLHQELFDMARDLKVQLQRQANSNLVSIPRA